jgi:hypothetical protein
MDRALAAVGFIVLSLVTDRALAHDPGLSAVTIQRSATALEYRMLLDDAYLPPQRRATSTTCSASGVIEASAGERALAFAASGCSSQQQGQTAFEGQLVLPSAAELRLSIALLAELPRGHQMVVTLLSDKGQVQSRQLLSRETPSLSLELPRTLLPPFFRLGLEHIARGFDHLLFLSLLVLHVRRFRNLLVLVSCFTAAHCLTLALATFGWIRLPSQLVEMSIAASIVWAAAEGVYGRTRPAHALTTFGFGLCHGLGFASELRALGVAGASLDTLAPLAWFNLGVEVAQLSWGSCLLLTLLALRRPTWSLGWVRALSAVALAVGIVWLVQRATWL